MKKIKAIGFDMDYTIVRYNTEAFERFTHQATLKKMVTEKNYPEEILALEFEFNRVIQGLVIDKKKGNLLKVSRFGKVKSRALAYRFQRAAENVRQWSYRSIRRAYPKFRYKFFSFKWCSLFTISRDEKAWCQFSRLRNTC
jgi:FMN phosphatase YigB (HAD superfamily)